MPRHVPNALTVVRIALVPVLVIALLVKTGTGDYFAAAVFCVASFTDGLDGYLARRHEIVSNLGKVLDPIADKLLIISSMVVLVSLDRLAAWVAMVVIAREFAVTVLRAAVGSTQGLVIAASQFGKLKTCFQIAMVLVLILDHSSHPARAQHYPVWVHLLVYVTVLVTVASGAEYFWAAGRGLNGPGESGSDDVRAGSGTSRVDGPDDTSRGDGPDENREDGAGGASRGDGDGPAVPRDPSGAGVEPRPPSGVAR